MKKLLTVLCILLCICSQNVYAKTYLEEVYEDYYKILDEENKLQGDYYITRGEFVALLVNSFGYTSDLYLCTFYDVYESEWDYKYIATAQNRGITLGDQDHSFNSSAYLRAEDAIVFLSRAYRLDKMSMGEYDVADELKVSDYAKDFSGYALNEGIYPKQDGSLLKGYEKISVKTALDLMNKYNELSELGFGSVKFVKGYPKTEISGKSNSVLVDLKTDKPCVVYYKMVENTGRDYDYTPSVEAVDSILTSISVANTQISVNLPAEQQKKYDIFFVLKGEDGKKSGVYSLRNVSVLPFTLGKGTPNDPYKIYSVYQFEQMRNYPDKCFELCVDIEYNKDWIPIGLMRNESNFSGTFDGGGHSIKGIRINILDNAGLFSELNGATVKNLYVDATVNAKGCAGVIAGVSNGGNITNCHVSGTVKADENIAGGIVGKNTGKIENSVSGVYSVDAKSYSGGICGTNFGTVANCISAVEKVSAGMYASSISGINSGGIIENCVAASMEINNDLTVQSGRITTNKENGITLNNYSYQDMLSGENIYVGKNMQDGEEISWQDIVSEDFYEKSLNWDFKDDWTLKYSPQYMLPVLKNVQRPILTEGLTVYAPMGISTEEELRAIDQKTDGHYYLTNSINLEYKNGDKFWTPLGVSDEYGNLYNTFTGTFDGRGYEIKNLKLAHKAGVLQYGLFGVVYGGTVRNLKVTNVEGSVRGTFGVIAGVNYGTIENCSTDGTLNVYDRNSESVVGGICGINYTNLISSDSKVKIIADTVSASLGGISGNNEGFIYNCSHRGEIKSVQGVKSSNVVAGGISGGNYSGFIYNCYADNNINSVSNTGYCGGIVGLMNGGEIYKCSSGGKINFISEKKNSSNAYLGGICGMASGGLIMNSFSESDIVAESNSGYVGGISGFCENASIQNVYSINIISQTGVDTQRSFAGGITGYVDNTYVFGAVAINPEISTNGKVGEISAYAKDGLLSANYCYDSMNIVGTREDNCESGTAVDLKTLKNTDFFFLPVYQDGLLGWDSVEYDGDVWAKSSNRHYSFPVLSGVKNQENFYNPINF